MSHRQPARRTGSPVGPAPAAFSLGGDSARLCGAVPNLSFPDLFAAAPVTAPETAQETAQKIAASARASAATSGRTITAAATKAEDRMLVRSSLARIACSLWW